MFDLTNTILLTVAFVNLVLAVLIIQRDWKSPINLSYLFLDFNIIFWSVFLFLFRIASTQDKILTMGKAVYAVASFLPLCFLLFIFLFTRLWNKGRRFLFILLAIPTAFFALVSAYSSLIVENTFTKDGINQLIFGPLYTGYLLYVTAYFILGFVYLIIRYVYENDDIKKAQYKLITIGTSVAILVGLFANAYLLTAFAFRYNWVGPVSTFVMAVFFAYAIVQYHLFNIKIISVQMFSGALAGILFIRLLTSKSGADFLVNGIVFVGSVGVTILLIRGVLKEVRAREEIERLAKSLEYANTELERIDKAKSEFVSIASHQLRTPLSIIKGYISLLREGNFGEVSDPVRKTLNKIYLSNERLIKLVADLLDLSRMQSGKMQYEFEFFNIIELINSIVDEFKIPADDKNLKLSWTDPKEPIVVWGDSWKLRQVIFNLIDNSLKYTQTGGIDVSIQKSNNIFTLAVKDTGVGMTQETMDSLFKKFSRGQDSSKINAQGLGLGLFIAKKIVDDHRGTLRLSSDGEGKGSTFYLDLPVKPV